MRRGIGKMITQGMMSSNTAEWATPQAFFDELDKEFNFTLDPCCTHENAKCEKHYTKAEDGLKHSWGGRGSIAIPLMDGKSASGCRKPMRVKPLW